MTESGKIIYEFVLEQTSLML